MTKIESQNETLGSTRKNDRSHPCKHQTQGSDQMARRRNFEATSATERPRLRGQDKRCTTFSATDENGKPQTTRVQRRCSSMPSEERTESSARKGKEVRLVSHEPMESR